MSVQRNKHYAFDWDDNLLFMPTNIILFVNSDKGQPFNFSTNLFAKYRKQMEDPIQLFWILRDGKKVIKEEKTDNPIILNTLHLIYEDELSFDEFRDHDNQNIFLEQVKEAIHNKTYGPAWDDFLEAMRSPKTALQSFIITARGHSPESMYEALEWLKTANIIDNIIPLKNIYPISYKGSEKYNGLASKPSAKKILIIKEIIEDIKKDKVQLFGFSDDDKNTIQMLEDEYQSLISDNIEISLYYTGNGLKEKIK